MSPSLAFPGGASGKEPTWQWERQETQVGSLGRADPLEEGMSNHSSILAGRIPMDRGFWQAAVHRITKSWAGLKWLSTHACMYSPLSYHTESFLCPKNCLCSVHPSLPTMSGNLWFFFLTVYMIFPFPECHIVENIQHVAFADWCLSLSNMCLGFLRVFSWLNNLFLL